MDLKNLNIGSMIKEKVAGNGIEMSRICKFLNCREEEILNMYESSAFDTEMLLRWSKLLEYDFFRLYSQHLILYSPQSSMNYMQKKKIPDSLPVFRKSLYTKEIIEFVLDKIRKGEMTKSKVISDYKIPKSTLYKWLHKYNLMEK
ncbi:transposase [Chryseobacterium sp. L7]|uniref:Transposase n=1 Tax=Chryseobacterium endalhagicum TaxID=2797638 RepID=A0ABS1QGI4_9FLAO|nr:transposase [Chryseobacterium endalhagicum]MBL1221023.1 transposase [Chryseobacterium endalhagicum]